MSKERNTGMQGTMLSVPFARRRVRGVSGDIERVQHQDVRLPTWMFWAYLLLIATIEALTVLTQPQIGVILQICVLIGLTLHSGLGQSDEARKLALALTLIPLVRILALSLPFMHVPLAIWYPIATMVLLIAAWVVARQSDLPRHVVGWHSHNRIFHIMMLSGGVGVGTMQYLIFQPPLPSAYLASGSLLLPLLLCIFLAGCIEEFVFRGLMQRAAWSLMGRSALFYSALLFAVLHIGYLSIPAVVFAFCVGLLFAYIAHKSHAVLGVALVHGTSSVTHLIILPLLIQRMSDSSGTLFWLAAMGMVTPDIILLLLALMAISLAGVLIVLSHLCACP